MNRFHIETSLTFIVAYVDCFLCSSFSRSLPEYMGECVCESLSFRIMDKTDEMRHTCVYTHRDWRYNRYSLCAYWNSRLILHFFSSTDKILTIRRVNYICLKFEWMNQTMGFEKETLTKFLESWCQFFFSSPSSCVRKREYDVKKIRHNWKK